MKKYFPLPLFFIFLNVAFAQQAIDLSFRQDDFKKNNDRFELSIETTLADLDFWTIAIKSEEDLNGKINFHYGDNKKIVNTNAHGISEDHWISEQLFNDGNVKTILLTMTTPPSATLKVRLYQVPLSLERELAPKINPPRSACPCPQPFYFDRDGWCPNGDCPEIIDPTITEVTHLIVHHAASTNISSDWAAVVQSIWDDHVNSNGWDDIGYNWLIDEDGNIYEGRGDNVQGAHFCGTNSNTAGICMLGEFTNQQPSPQAIAALTSLLAWKACDGNIDPTTSSFHPSSNLQLPHIAGHRDGCATECPGNAFYPTISGIRDDVQDQIQFTCANLPAPTNLKASTMSSTSIALEWNDNAQDETAFLLERANWTNEDYAEIAMIEKDITTYLDEGLQPNSVYFYRLRATNETDTTAYSNEVGISTVVQNVSINNEFNIQVFPNPTNEFLNIEIEQIENKIKGLTIFNTLGQLIWSTKENGNQKINISSWSPGNYFLQINIDDKNYFKTIFIF